MSFIATTPPSRATAEGKAAYRYMYRVAGGWIPGNIFKTFGLRPATMTRYIRDWEVAMWSCDEPRRTRELVAAATSRLARCDY